MSSKILILSLKMLNLPYFTQTKNFLKNLKQSFQTIFNACHQVQYQKNLMMKFKEFKNNDIGPENPAFTPFYAY